MVLENPLWQQANTYPARLDRQFIEDVFDVEGVIKPAGGALLVSPRAAGANMSVDIAAGRAVVKGDDEANQGSYRCISTAVENRPIGAPPGADSRIDLVIARVRDANVIGGVSSDWVIEVIPGAVAQVPVAPAVPNTAIALAQVLVAAGTLSIDLAKITDRRTGATNRAYPSLLLVDAKGDLLVGSAADTVVRQAVGANNTVLTADSAAASGVKWAAAVASRRIGGALFSARDGAPALSFASITPYWLMDATADESVIAQGDVPADWASFDVSLLWTNAGAGTGNVVWRFGRQAAAAGNTLGTAPADIVFAANATGSAGAQNVIVKTTLATNVVPPLADSSLAVHITRLGSAAGDTLGNDAGLIAVVFTKAS